MSNYNIEGGMQFYEELYKSLNDDTDTDTENENSVCLITNSPLTDHFVKLNCGHTFNYLPLFYDVKNHKLKFNGMEYRRIGPNNIRCPYCRKVQHKLLPYYEELGVEKIPGINSYNPDTINNSMTLLCNYCDENNAEQYTCGEYAFKICPSEIKKLYGNKDKYKGPYCVNHKKEIFHKCFLESQEKKRKRNRNGAVENQNLSVRR